MYPGEAGSQMGRLTPERLGEQQSPRALAQQWASLSDGLRAITEDCTRKGSQQDGVEERCARKEEVSGDGVEEGRTRKGVP